MAQRTPNLSGSELFIVDNSDTDWKVRSYLSEWCALSKAIDIATGYFEIGALLSLKDKWQNVDRVRILMGDEVSRRTKRAFAEGLKKINDRLDQSLETEKAKNDFLEGVPAIVEGLRSGKIQCRVYRKDKFHAKAYLTHGRAAVARLPGLMLHDSPREADLGGRIYRSFIRFIASLVQHYGKNENCPFQYILTTTTAPPKKLQTSEYVKLRLDASKLKGLLLGRNIAEPPKRELTLFNDE